MVINIELSDRIYQDIEAYCKANNLEISNYLVEIIEEEHSINKFGDMNEMFPKANEAKTVKAKTRKTKTDKQEEIIAITEQETHTDKTVEIEKPTTVESVTTVTKKKRTLKTL